MRGDWPPRSPVRRSAGLRTLEQTLLRAGLGPVAGADEAGRGACAGPLVVAAAVLRPVADDRLLGLTDSKLLTAAARDHYFDLVTRLALATAVVVVPAAEVDRIGVHVANIEGMRRAVARLRVAPGYVLLDGFRVPGLTAPSLPVIGGDRTAACVAAASVLAKVTRDRIMTGLDADLPGYGFAGHKGYSTPEHSAALRSLGACPEHRMSYANVAAVVRGERRELGADPAGRSRVSAVDGEGRMGS
ncbi:ribonuclease HII [Rhodococcus aerolatus]